MTCPHNSTSYPNDGGPGKCEDCGEALPALGPVPPCSPSGSYLQHTGAGTNWVLAHELPRVLKAMLQHTMVHAEREGDALVYRHWRCKYMNIRTDMRTGHFIITDNDGKRVDGDDEVLSALGLAPLVNPPPQLNG